MLEAVARRSAGGSENAGGPGTAVSEPREDPEEAGKRRAARGTQRFSIELYHGAGLGEEELHLGERGDAVGEPDSDAGAGAGEGGPDIADGAPEGRVRRAAHAQVVRAGAHGEDGHHGAVDGERVDELQRGELLADGDLAEGPGERGGDGGAGEREAAREGAARDRPGGADREAERGAQRGADHTFILAGNNLQDAQEVVFYSSGLTVSNLEVVNNTQVKAAVKIAPDARLGEHSLRVRTADGREFSIGNGFTDAQRESPPPIGAIVTYRFRGLTSKGTPRFPTFLRARKD